MLSVRPILFPKKELSQWNPNGEKTGDMLLTTPLVYALNPGLGEPEKGVFTGPEFLTKHMGRTLDLLLIMRF